MVVIVVRSQNSLLAEVSEVFQNCVFDSMCQETWVSGSIGTQFPLIYCLDWTAGILRGCGLQNPATVINIFAFYCVGIPTAVLFGFHYNKGAMVTGLFLILSFSHHQ